MVVEQRTTQSTHDAKQIQQDYLEVRRFTEQLVEPLSAEDCVIQSMPDVSPTRWHLAHVTWFFETFVLAQGIEGYESFHPDFVYLFNSYYNTVGEQFPRNRRGLISRPTVAELREYRSSVDERMVGFLDAVDPDRLAELAPVILLGCQHEQQHQELILTDIKHVLSCNPLFPTYRKSKLASGLESRPLGWIPYEEGVRWIGFQGATFCFDNERSRHRTFVERFELADRLATNGEYQAFVEDGGYERPELWLSEGWSQVTEESWQAPPYWIQRDGEWWQFTLAGLLPLEPAEPVCHLSYYEADAFARWSEARLPTEAEWEIAAQTVPLEGNFVEQGHLHPTPDPDGSNRPAQLFGDVWEWTSSSYGPYPGYQASVGALGEYNGKFMCNQYVLRGGSCATLQTHIRPTYRNFFPTTARWQFSGVRLARFG